MVDFWAALVTALVLVGPAEVADKTFFLSAALGGNRDWRKSAVATGAAAAFLGTMLLSVTLGELVFQFVPDALRYGLITIFFAWWTRKSYKDFREWKPKNESAKEPRPSWWAQARSAAGMLAIAEMGDKSMFAAGGVAAKSGEFLATFIGSWVGITVVVLLGLVFGRVLSKWIKPRLMLGGAALVFLGVTLWSSIEFGFALFAVL